MSDCYVSLAGGLGNQLFQAANGYSYARTHNKNLILCRADWGACQGHNPDKYSTTIFSNFDISDQPPPANATILGEPKFNYTPHPYVEGDVVFQGYFQSLKYFLKHGESFKDKLNIKYTTVERKPAKEKYVGVHIRRGDYLHFPIHMVCNTDFFKRCFLEFPDKRFHIYSDSPDIVAKELSNCPEDITIMDPDDELNTLITLSCYRNLICSNSSFSWWASFLGPEKTNILVPDRWFNNFQDHEDIYRDDFKRITV